MNAKPGVSRQAGVKISQVKNLRDNFLDGGKDHVRMDETYESPRGEADRDRERHRRVLSSPANVFWKEKRHALQR